MNLKKYSPEDPRRDLTSSNEKAKDPNAKLTAKDRKRIELAAEIGEADTAWDKFRVMCRENKLAVASAIVIIVIALMAIFAPYVAPYDPTEQDLVNRLQGMSWEHIFGTDQLGRDVFSRMIYGARISLVIGLLPTFISLAMGTVLGLVSGYMGKGVDFVIMRLADITMAFPSLLLAMVVMYTLGAGIVNIFLALTLVSWAGTARVIRSQTLSLREMEYIEAARSMGVSKSAIMFRHILPNCLPNLIVLFTLNIPGSILSESSLSFLGIGAQSPMTSWGLMVSEGKQYLFTDPVIAIAPGVAILVLALAFNFLGDGVRDILDPYLTGSKRGADMSETNTLEIQHLRTVFYTRKGVLPAVDDVSITVPKGKIVGIVGESGCGKSMTAMSVMQLIRKPGKIENGKILFCGEDLLKKTPEEMEAIRGSRIGMIFQEPMTSLNPVYTVGHQVEEAIRIHEHLPKKELHERAVEIFKSVGIPEPEERLYSYPHQLSGGLRQRVMIGMAMACKPDLLIADEPTTALDVTIEAQILSLMKKLRDENGTSILLITHNMGVVAKMCDFVYVMYAGRVMESAEVFELFQNVQHPYTAGLLKSIPRIDHVVDRLYSIPGVVPNLLHLPAGCSFCTRCPYATYRCAEQKPEPREVAPGHFVRCFTQMSEEEKNTEKAEEPADAG